MPLRPSCKCGSFARNVHKTKKVTRTGTREVERPVGRQWEVLEKSRRQIQRRRLQRAKCKREMERDIGEMPGVRGQFLWAWENLAAKSSDRKIQRLALLKTLTRVRAPRLCSPFPKPRSKAAFHSLAHAVPQQEREMKAKAEALQSAREWIARLKRELLF